MPAKAIIQQRRDTAAQWTSVNPVLASGEIGVETDTLNFKIGNGTSTWTQLSYRGFIEGSALVYGNGLTFNSGNNTLSANFGTTSTTVLAGSHANATSGVHGVTGDVVGTNSVQDLANKTLINFREKFNVVASGASGTLNIDSTTAAAWFYSVNATANFTLNFRSSSTETLNSILPVGSALTLTVFIRNGSTPYYPTAFSIDGTAVTPVWQVNASPLAGDANSINAYTFTILKTAATPTYTVFASQTRFG